MTISLLDRVENTEEKGENAGHQGLLVWCRLKSGLCGKELSIHINPLPHNPDFYQT